MKLISLNTWGGKIFEPLIDFISGACNNSVVIKNEAKDTDIFCFQEIYDTKSDIKQYNNEIRANLLMELTSILPDFQYFYFPVLFDFDDSANRVNFDLAFGLAIFLKKNIEVTSNKNYFIYKDKSFSFLKKDFSNIATPMQVISFYLSGKLFTIFNFHGTPSPAAKRDTKKRLLQSEKVKSIIDKSRGAKILVGDFNLSLNTKSIKMFEKDMKNLIREFNIKRTRSALSPFWGKWNFQKYADYTFVSSDVLVKNFQVPKIRASDHLPMILEFS